MNAKITLLILSFFVTSSLFAQQITVTGEVTSSEDGMPVPGVNVIVVGTTRGVSTDFDGLYAIEVSRGEILEFSSVGLKTVRVTIGNQTVINVTLEPDIAALDEIVIIGYGTQKKADLTGSIATVQSEEIEKTPTANIMQSLQGKVSGVQVVSNGSPGDSPTVRIRGLGTYQGSTNVLFVVDGMFYSNIDFLNTKDIKSVNILKDASSSAIYGVRAANGVIIIETKTGSLNKKPEIEYDGYTGVQYAQNVLKLANAEQFVTMAYESGSQPDIQHVLDAMQRYGRSRVNPNVPDVNTDWYEEILRPGLISSHSIGVTGGGNDVAYSIGANYLSQEGILDMKNEYERFNIRSKIDATIAERFKVGVNTVFSNATKFSPENGAWFSAYFAVPIMPVIDEQNTAAAPIRFSDARNLFYRGRQNPFYAMTYNDNRLKIRKLLTNLYMQVDIIADKLTFKTTYNNDFSSLEERNVNLPFTDGFSNSQSSIARRQNTFFNQIWDNTLTYNDSFGDHNLTVLAGTSFRDEAAGFFGATGTDITGIEFETSWFLDFADPTSFSGNVGENGSRLYGVSYFGRVAYNYKDTYLLYGTIRADGSSKFTRDPWGYFPSVGAGWVISNEGFMKDNGVVDFLKLRAAWGKLGNDGVAASSGANTISVITTTLGDMPITGVSSTSNFTNNTWEVVEEMNFGINVNTLNNRLGIDADYYIRDTENAIMPVEVPIANVTVQRNSGVIRNKGFEIGLNWSDAINDDLKYSISTNFTTLDNEVLEVEDPKGYINAGSAEFRQRSRPGDPLFAFYGFETNGVYQNQAQVSADATAQYEISNGRPIVPGDLIYKDNNNDGIIDDNDRVILGSYLPKFSYGGNVGLSYKGFDFSLSFYGVSGNKILNRKRGEIIFTNDTNMDRDLAINRWHGEGTSNTYPSSAGLRKGWNQKLSNFWIEDGDFFRIQNIQLAYTLKGESLIGVNMPETRIYLTAERPFTFFKYNGFDPEVSDGVDRQTYPVPAIYTVGVNIKI